MAGENFDEKSKPKMVSLDVIVDVEVIFWKASKKRSAKGRSPQRTAVGREAREEGGPKSRARERGRVELTHVRGAG